MTDLHAEIMNLPVNRVAMAEMDINMRVAYKEGHRDARHAAAELAACHSASLADAQAEIARLRGALDAVYELAHDPAILTICREATQ